MHERQLVVEVLEIALTLQQEEGSSPLPTSLTDLSRLWVLAFNRQHSLHHPHGSLLIDDARQENDTTKTRYSCACIATAHIKLLQIECVLTEKVSRSSLHLCSTG